LRALLAVQITPVLLKALDEGDQALRSAAIEVLQALIYFDQVHDEEGARERLQALAERTESEVAGPAALALGTLRDQRAVVPLLRILEGYSSLYAAWHRAGMVYSPAGKAVQFLGQLRATSAIEPLLNLLDPQGEDIDFQRALYKALAHIGDVQVVGRLLPLLQPQPQSTRECSVQQALLATLAQLNDPGLVEALLKLLNPRPTSLWESDFQMHLLKALGNLGDQRAIEPLVQWLNPNAHHSWEWSFQERLAETLRQLGETRAELQAVEQAVHNWRKTVQFKVTVTMVRKQQGDQHMP
jgi:HEAT repeat protein